MLRPRTGASLAVACAALAAALAAAGGCFSERANPAAPAGQVAGKCTIPVSSPLIGATGALVAIRDLAYQPQTVHVKAGTTVTWVNCEPETVEAHTSTSDAGAWSSPFIPPGATYSHTFESVGRFDYSCVPHPFMHGTVVVE